MILYWSSAFSIVNRKISDFISWIRRFFGLHQMLTKAVCSIFFMDMFLCYNFTKDTYSLFHWFLSFLFFIVKESWAWDLCLIVLFPLIFVAIRIRCWVDIDSDWHAFFPCLVIARFWLLFFYWSFIFIGTNCQSAFVLVPTYFMVAQIKKEPLELKEEKARRSRACGVKGHWKMENGKKRKRGGSRARTKTEKTERLKLR